MKVADYYYAYFTRTPPQYPWNRATLGTNGSGLCVSCGGLINPTSRVTWDEMGGLKHSICNSRSLGPVSLAWFTATTSPNGTISKKPRREPNPDFARPFPERWGKGIDARLDYIYSVHPFTLERAGYMVMRHQRDMKVAGECACCGYVSPNGEVWAGAPYGLKVCAECMSIPSVQLGHVLPVHAAWSLGDGTHPDPKLTQPVPAAYARIQGYIDDMYHNNDRVREVRKMAEESGDTLKQRTKQQVKDLGDAVKLGLALGAVNEGGELFVEVVQRLAKDNPTLLGLLETDSGREIAKLVVAVGLHVAGTHSDLLNKGQALQRISELQISASMFALTTNYLSQLREPLLKLAKIGESLEEGYEAPVVLSRVPEESEQETELPAKERPRTARRG